MSTTQELIDWLKKQTTEPVILDREECDSIVARLEAAETMAVALDDILDSIAFCSAGEVCQKDDFSDASKALQKWEGLP